MIRQRIGASVAIASGVLLALAIVLWARSYFTSDFWFRSRFHDEGSWTIWTQDSAWAGRGGIGFNRTVQSGTPPGYERDMRSLMQKHAAGIRWHQTRTPMYPNFNFNSNDKPVLGFRLATFDNSAMRGGPTWGFQLIVPLWFMCIVFSLAPAIWIWRWRRRRWQAWAGLCQKCGYDLRATPDQCPECGAKVDESAQIAPLPADVAGHN